MRGLEECEKVRTVIIDFCSRQCRISLVFNIVCIVGAIQYGQLRLAWYKGFQVTYEVPPSLISGFPPVRFVIPAIRFIEKSFALPSASRA